MTNDATHTASPQDPTVLLFVVDSFDACLRFYVGLLGCQEAQRGEGDGGARFALLRLAGALEFLISEPGSIRELGSLLTRGASLVVPHPDVLGAWHVLSRRASSLGVGIASPADGPLGTTLAFTDPAGTRVLFVQHETRVP